MESEKKWEDLDLSSDEVKRLAEALKKEEFRKLLAEYAEEISDPVNRKKYEDEILQLENERGMDVKFVNPEPGYVIKTTNNGSDKVFINVCKNEHIEKPRCVKKVGPDGKQGHQWSIPHSFAPVKDDNDKNGNSCKVIDFVVHHETYRMAETNFQFKKMLQDTAFEGIERQFDMKLDTKNVKHPNTKFKGTPTATVIRTKKDEAKDAKVDPNDPINKVPYPYGDKSSAELANERKASSEAKSKKQAQYKAPPSKNNSEYETPRYNIIHRGYLDLQDFRAAPDAKQSTRPKELVVEIDLPLLNSAGCVDLDILPRQLTLKSEKPAKYELNVDLPYEVDEEHGGAKFDKSKRKLIVTLPVIPAKIRQAPFTGNSDALQAMDAEGDRLTNDLDMKLPGDVATDEKPLIEVLSSNEPNGHEMTKDPATGDCADIVPRVVNGHADESPLTNCTSGEGKSPDIPKYYTFPSFDYLQDDESVTVILDIKNGVRDSLTKQFAHADSKCCGLDVTIDSMGSGGFPMNYRAVIRFEASCHVEAENSYIDVGPHNVVVTLIKKDSCLGHWEKFSIGQTSDDLQEALFLSEQTLKKELDMLDQQISSQAPVNRVALPDIEVKDMNSSKLSVEIKGSTRLKRTVSESGEEIEVVHRTHLPRLQGILKQRSVSESSDDVSSSARSRQLSSGHDSAASGVSGSDDAQDLTSGDDVMTPERKKSVSFNENIDSATFRCHQSVSSMRETLKNKRRKQRKHDKRSKQERRHRNSNSLSEVSSDDGCGYNELTSPHNTSQSAPGSATDAVLGVDETTTSGDHKQSPAAEKTTDQSVPASVAVHSEQSAKQNGSAANKQNGAHEAKQNGDAAHTNGVKKGEAERSNGYDSDDFDADETEANDQIAAAGNKMAPEKEAHAPETMLNWEEGAPQDALKPVCAVSFSNDVMFDLDVD